MRLDTLMKVGREILTGVASNGFAVAREQCPSCRRLTRWIKYGNRRNDVRCLRCRKTLISLGLLSYLRKCIELDRDRDVVYELSFHGPVFDFLRREFRHFYFSEFFASVDDARGFEHIPNEDVQNLSFPDNFFDLVTCTEVFEHVADAPKGFREIARVLKPAGVFVFTVPFDGQDRTEQNAKLRPDGTIEWIGEPEFHDSRVYGPAAVPVFWRYSEKTIARELIDYGFREAEVVHYRMNDPRFPPLPMVVARK